MELKREEYFRNLLGSQLKELLDNAEGTLEGMGKSKGNFPDPTDRALDEFARMGELRIRDRERKLIAKIQKALRKMDEGTFGVCISCEEPIEEKRLRARPVTDQCIDCKSLAESREIKTKNW